MQENEGLVKNDEIDTIDTGNFDVPTDGSTTTFFKWLNKQSIPAGGLPMARTR
jgi:hypothetical protein